LNKHDKNHCRKSDNKSLHNCYNVLRANHENSFPVVKDKLNNHFNSGRSPITETSKSNKTIVISYFFNQGRPSKRFDIRVRFKRSGLIVITVMSRVDYSFVFFDSLNNNGGWKKTGPTRANKSERQMLNPTIILMESEHTSLQRYKGAFLIIFPILMRSAAENFM